MRKITLLMVLIVGMIIHTYSQTPHSDTLSVNNIKALVRAAGMQFWVGDTTSLPGSGVFPIYQYPNGSGKTTIFNSCLWIGGLDVNNQLHLAAERYCQNGTDFWGGPLTTDGLASTTPAISANWDKVWKINKQDLVNYLNSAAYPSNPPTFVFNWPAHGDTVLHQSYHLAPFVDINNNGKYEPLLGDYPKIYGDQCIFFIINDQKQHTETLGIPVGAEIHVFAYAFSNPVDSALFNSIFYKYKIINRSVNTLYNCYLGQFTDIDIGFPYDDYVACDVERSTYYGYNGTAVDGAGQFNAYDSLPPAQGVTILGGPTLDADGIDNPSGGCNFSVNGINFGDNIIDNERIGMSRFVYYNNSASTIGEPESSSEIYNYMKGFWKNGTPLSWDSTGYNPLSTITARFMFPGLSDTLNWGTGCGVRPTPNDWSEVDLHNAPNDRRGLASMGPFTFNAGAVQYVDIVYTTATAYNFKSSSVDVMKQRIDHIRDLFVNSPQIFQGFVGVAENQDLKYKLYPNPANDYLCIEGIGLRKPDFSIFNIVGQLVKSVKLETNATVINITDLKSGIYFVQMKTDNNTRTIKFVKR
jgi:hypothetical protein